MEKTGNTPSDFDGSYSTLSQESSTHNLLAFSLAKTIWYLLVLLFLKISFSFDFLLQKQTTFEKMAADSPSISQCCLETALPITFSNQFSQYRRSRLLCLQSISCHILIHTDCRRSLPLKIPCSFHSKATHTHPVHIVCPKCNTLPFSFSVQTTPLILNDVVFSHEFYLLLPTLLCSNLD